MAGPQFGSSDPPQEGLLEEARLHLGDRPGHGFTWAIAGWKLDHGLGGDEGVVTGLRVLRKESAGLSLGALLALVSVGTTLFSPTVGSLPVLPPKLFSTPPSSPLRIWPPAPSRASFSGGGGGEARFTAGARCSPDRKSVV